MNFKPIELQISMPRTTDAGQQQQQLSNKPVADQTMLGTQAQREAEKDRTRAARPDETAESRIRDQSKGSGGQGDHARKGKQQSEGDPAGSMEVPAPHPYKGRRLDITL
ncbi:hypothetical protein XYCOK13_14400 [Xylanibacillus composti]|uniref:Uncharacterized protein n=1 Tax=Xylanibacillus composti TaxID=1572762 RepID=A0A8J4M2J9_9BACL|nr:hypothetical protein [Xylanibacillus composti]GIQ68616.1 hypothetical protein XYCOK13_14400 [Xylanibacillus composti]